MLPEHKSAISSAISSALVKAFLPLAEFAALPVDEQPSIQLELPKQAQHGDISCNIAMQLVKLLKKPPRIIAQDIITALDTSLQTLVDDIQIAGAGFINFYLNQTTKTQVLNRILQPKLPFGFTNDTTQNIILEFVSANPTGPLHIGHGRQAALGDVLAELLHTQGIRVHKEFYYNDAGVQIETLARSVQSRLKGLTPQHSDWPANAYNGEYIQDIADAFQQKACIHVQDMGSIQANGDITDINNIRRFAVAYLRQEQDTDLQAFGLKFDHYYLESSLYSDGKVQDVVETLQNLGACYRTQDEKGNALWLKTTDYGDDKDRVMQKSDGSYTYFVPDIAYHLSKFKRGFEHAINIQGFDHHGTTARVRAGLQALKMDIPKDFITYILHKMVTVMRDGEEVKISKRAGSYVTLRDLIEWSGGAMDGTNTMSTSEKQAVWQKGRDAVRFFLLSRKADSEFVFDINLALQQNDENPVYYVQYAHARICSILQKAEQEGYVWHVQQNAWPSTHMLTHESELALLRHLSCYPDMLAESAQNHAPHNLSFYARDLAGFFHAFYNSCKIIQPDQDVLYARLVLIQAVQSVLQSVLTILGISAPIHM